MNFRRLTAIFTAAATIATAGFSPTPVGILSGIAYADSSTWSGSDGIYTYTHSSNPTEEIPWLNIDIADVDWSTIKYVSADITVNGIAAAAFGGSYNNGEWYNCNYKTIDNDTVTIYLEPEGIEFDSLEINFGMISDTNYTTAGAEITVKNIKFSTEERDYSDVTGEWYSAEEGVWCYRNDNSNVSEIDGLDLMRIADNTNVNWSAVKYISADIGTAGKAQPVIDINFTGIDDDWTSGTPKTVENGTTTVYYNTNGETPVWSSLSFWQYEDGVALTANQLITVSNITFSTEERDYSDVVGEWYEQNGSWHYTHGSDSSQNPSPLDLLSLKPNDIDWADIKYVSADITADNAAFPVIGGNLTGEDDSWTTGSEKMLSEAGTVTAYLNTNGAEPTGLCVEFWHVDWDNNFAIEAGTNITVSNITFSTEERDYSDVTGEWYSPDDGVWCFRNGDSIAYDSIPTLGLENSVTDWSAIKYISADITVEGKACPTIGANKNGNWTNGPEKLTENGSTTIYLNTNGAEIVDPCIEFWWCSDNADVLSANALITVSNIVFSTEERDYSDIIGEWYSPEDGVWCFRNGDRALADCEIPSLDLPIQDYVSDWSAVKYISAKVEVSGNARVVMGGEYSGQWTDSTAITIKDSSDIVILYTEGKVFDYNNISFWNINETATAVSANAFITVSEITVSETYPTDYTSITGQWVKLENGQYYYNHGDRSDIAYVEGLAVDCPYDIADVQSISITAKVVMTGGTPESIKLVVAGIGKDGDPFVGYNFPFGADELTVVRKYRGNVVSYPHLDISFGQNDLAVIKNGGSIEIYISDITFSTDPINIIYSTPNDLLIDDNETDITSSDIEHDIMYHDISRIETTGTLKIYTEKISDTQNINVFWREWSDFDNITKLETTPVAVGDGVYEIRVTEDALNIIHEKAPKACELALTGTGYRFLKATFTPDPDAPMPAPEEIKPDAITDTDKTQLEQSKNNTIDETKAPDSADEFEYGKAHGHKSGRKKHKDGHWMYALRIVQRVEKKDLQHAESVTITVYSKKADQYITLTADTCFSYLNINGFKVKANNKDAFLTVVLDNIPEDDEITFTCFTINYKK